MFLYGNLKLVLDYECRCIVTGNYETQRVATRASLILTFDALSVVCVQGFTGRTCDVNIDDCSGDPCHDDAVCIDGVDSYVCQNCSGGTQQVSMNVAPFV